VVTWKEASNRLGDASGFSVVARLFQADGTGIGTDFRVNTTTLGNQDEPALFALPGGGFRIVWDSENRTITPQQLMFQDFDAAGAPARSEIALPFHTAFAEGTLAAYGAVDGAGAQAFLALDRLAPTAYEVQLVRVDAAGAQTLLTGDATGPDVDVLEARHLLTAVETPGGVWISGMRLQMRLPEEGEEIPIDGPIDIDNPPDPSTTLVRAPNFSLWRVDVLTGAVTGATDFGITAPYANTLTLLDDGLLVMAWMQPVPRTQDVPRTPDVLVQVQLVSATGAALGSPGLLDRTTLTYDGTPLPHGLDVVALPDGQFAVFWTKSVDEPSYVRYLDAFVQGHTDIVGQLFAADGTAQGARFDVGTTRIGNQNEVSAIYNAAREQIVVTWTDESGFATGLDVDDLRGAVLNVDRVFTSAAEWHVLTDRSYDLNAYGGDDSLFGGAGDDTLRGGGGDDLLRGGAGDDVLGGGLGDDRLLPGAGRDDVYGGAGFDTVDFSGAGGGVDVALGAGAFRLTTVSQGMDRFDGIEAVIGSDHADTLFGGALAERLEGGAGDDRIAGGGGNDTLLGGDGTGDAVNYYFAGAAVRVDLRAQGNFQTISAGQGVDLLTGFENILGSGTGNNTLQGDDAANRIAGYGGDDVILGWGGDDLLFGGGGNDWVLGGDGADLIVADAGNDTLLGGAGDDRLVGGDAGDTLTGGAGADTFVFGRAYDSRPGNGMRDVIRDFEPGVDAIDLSVIDADVTLTGAQDFVFVGNAAFSAAGQLRFVSDGTHGFVLGDVTGDGMADLNLMVWNTPALSVDDLVL